MCSAIDNSVEPVHASEASSRSVSNFSPWIELGSFLIRWLSPTTGTSPERDLSNLQTENRPESWIMAETLFSQLYVKVELLPHTEPTSTNQLMLFYEVIGFDCENHETFCRQNAGGFVMLQ